MNQFFRKYYIVIFLVLSLWTKNAVAQNDSIRIKKDSTVLDSTVGKVNAVFDSSTFVAAKPKQHDPHKATMRSLMFPGWGQAYNKEYWKIPIVWGALAIPGVAYINNNKWYKEASKAYKLIYTATQGASANRDTVTLVNQLSSEYKTYWNQLYANSSGSAGTTFLSNVQSQRNYYRRNRDYSVLWFLILWGINVADATVFGHLKNFDISPNLSMEVNPTYIQAVRGPGINLTFNLK